MEETAHATVTDRKVHNGKQNGAWGKTGLAQKAVYLCWKTRGKSI